MKITVFGGAGFLGSHVCDCLSEAGHSVLVADVRPSPWLRPDQRMAVLDITDSTAVAAAVRDAQAVFNFAGIADIAEAAENPVGTAQVNVMGNMYILEACRNAAVQQYIFASSLYVYGRNGGFYRVSKQACELYIHAYQERYGLPCTIVRYGSLYGPRADKRNAIHRFVCEALEQGCVTYYGTPDSEREYVHVSDAAHATVSLLEKNYAGNNIIITSSRAIRIDALFRMLGEMLGKPLQVRYEHKAESGHYSLTPYSFMPQLGRRLVPPLTVDLGQGLLTVMEEVFAASQPSAPEDFF